MNTMNQEQLTRRYGQEQSHRQELVEYLNQAMPYDGKNEAFKGIFLLRASSCAGAVHAVTEPSLCIIAQGSKEIFLGEERYQYDPYSYLLTTIELPLVARVLDATKEHPYLAIRLTLDPVVVSSVMMEIDLSPSRGKSDVKALTVSAVDVALLETAVRLVRVLDSPQEARVLLPLITREIIYRILVSEQGDRLRQMTVHGGHTHRIARAIERISKEFNQPLRIEELAKQVGMSVSGFHHYFKAVTAMSPLQFQKQMRLQEARRLMLGEDLDAASAGYRVGYDNAAHFSREYKRLFGEPPIRNVERLREATTISTSI
ncbi:AraC family transcriptional regulator [bacterium]|nr:MAG: AraC family transcriptional regulator [bacterium]